MVIGFLGGRVAINCKTMSKNCQMLQKDAKDGKKLHKKIQDSRRWPRGIRGLGWGLHRKDALDSRLGAA